MTLHLPKYNSLAVDALTNNGNETQKKNKVQSLHAKGPSDQRSVSYQGRRTCAQSRYLTYY